VKEFLTNNNASQELTDTVVHIVSNLGFKTEIGQRASGQATQVTPELAVVQDADRLDAIGALGVSRCLVYGGAHNTTLYDPALKPNVNITKEEYMDPNRKTYILAHFYEKLLKIKDMMKSEAGKKRAQGRHAFMEQFLSQFYAEWNGQA
jgi:uncharacterized protein